ncbi:unnamed protein product [Mucor hiemalis]
MEATSTTEEIIVDSTKQRLRVTRACDFCRRRKVKCIFQEGESCYNCQAYNEECKFTANIKKRGPQKGYSDDLEARISEMESAIQEAAQTQQKRRKKLIDMEIKRNRALVQKRSKRKGSPAAKKGDPPPGLLSNLFEEFGILDPRQWPSGIAYDSIHYLGDSATLQFLSSKLNLQNETKLEGHTIKKFGDGIVLIADPGVSSSKSSKIPEFQWPENIHSSGEDIHKYIYTVTGVDRYTAVRLLKIYFSHIHPILPVIDKTEFLKQYRDRIETYPSGELLNAMFGAAARFVECESLEPERKRALPADAVWDVPVGWSNHFFDQAEYIISKWSNAQTVSNVQAIILILNHRGDRDSKSSACWQLGGYAIRLAHLLGLHRSCDDWDIPNNEKETRKRVWWALYITDRFQTAILGRPINLRDEDINVPYPDSGANIEEVMDAYEADKDRIQNNETFPRFPSLTAPFDYETNTNRERPQIYELFIQFIKLSEILGRILQGIHSPRAKKFSSLHGSDGLVTRLDFELTEWRYNFPNALKSIQLPDFNEDAGHFAPVIASMLMFYCSTLILLHQPFIRRTQSRSSFTSQQICSSAASRGMRIACRLTARDYLMCPYSFTLYPIMQFGLIHMFNGKNPNLQIATSAKLYLKRGTKLLENIKEMSSTATRLYKVFRDITEISDLHLSADDNVDRTLAEEEYHLEENVRRLKERYGAQPDRRTMSSIMDAIMLQPPSVPKDPLLPSYNNAQERTEKVNPTTATAVPEVFYDASNSQPPLNMEAEAFSLTQFGYETTNDTSSLDYILQNLNALSGLSNDYLQPEQTVYAHFTPPLQQQQQLDAVDSHIFKSDPTNVFWDLPSNMEGLNQWIDTMNQTDWNAFNQTL